MKKPDFYHFRESMLRQGQPMRQQDREPYRAAIVNLLEEGGKILVQKSRKDGHNESLVEIHGSWIGTDFSTAAMIEALKNSWPNGLFPDGEEKHWIEGEEEIVTLDFAWMSGGDRGFLTGRIKLTVDR